jgi:alkanesulfonate monooxygenase SsuD/methylene tetrahydromethanopterin reductase-like flavin-dependent oxidoreductase (luciferase family)
MTMIDQALSCSVIGSATSVTDGLRDFLARTQVDELMITANIYEHAARLKSFAMVAEINGQIEHRVV